MYTPKSNSDSRSRMISRRRGLRLGGVLYGTLSSRRRANEDRALRWNRYNIFWVLVICIAAILTACSGGGGTNVAGGGGGVVGTGKQVVTGEVTGFGSVFVNGLEFTRSTAPGVSSTPVELAFDNLFSPVESVLRPGMMVSVSGMYDAATSKGSYTRIVFSPELRGLLDNGSVNAVSGSFTVLGRMVLAGASTIFDGVADMSELNSRQNQGLELEVSGYLTSGVVQASRISLKSSGFSSGMVQLKGTVSSISTNSFVLGSLTVSTSGATFVGMTAADLATVGLIVEVRGTLNGSSLVNARIERKSATSGLLPNDSLCIKGVAVGIPAAGRFVLSGPDGALTVIISATVFVRGSGPADASIIVPDARLEVEGSVQSDGSLAARKISVETEKTVRLEGDISSINAAAGSLTVNGVTVFAISETSYRDSSSLAVSPFLFSGLSLGDHLQVYGFLDGSGRAVANQIERFNASSANILQGLVSAKNLALSQVTILGVIVQSAGTLSKGSTIYPDFSTFAAQVSSGSTVLKAKGNWTGTGFTATSLEIQQ